MNDWKEHLLDKLFEGMEHFYESKGVLHFGYDTTGKPGHWIAHPFCGKKLIKWVGFGEIHLSKTDNICPTCLLIYAADQVSKKGLKFISKQEGKQ